MSLNGKTALVTGASRGIGRAIALRLAEDGANVAVIYAGSADKAEAVVNEITALGVNAKAYRCNVADSAAVNETVKAVTNDLGKIDILVNNAGIIVRKTVLDTTVEEWDRCMDIGLKGTFLFSKHVVPIMIKEGGGVIVNTASGAAIKGVPDAAPYNAVKGGVAALTRGMAVDFGKYNIRVNCVCPGDILTPMLISEGLQTGKITTGDPKTPEEQAAFDAFIASCGDYRPLQRIGTAEQIAYTFLFLASDMSYYATGGSFVVDGGRCS